MDDIDEPLTDEEYHAHGALSRSAIVDFRESRRLFHGRHVLRLPEAQKETTDEMQLGTLTHAELLEPGSLSDRIVSLASTEWKDFRTKAARQWRKDQKDAGNFVVKPEEMRAVYAMVDAASQVAQSLFMDKGEVIIEQPIFWEDAETGMACRCKPDWLVLGNKLALIPDFKTTEDASPNAFKKKIHTMSLFLQDAHYSRGVTAKYGLPVKFIFIVVEKKFPYRVGVYDIDRETAMGRLIEPEYRDTLAAINRCHETGNWSEPWEGRPNSIELDQHAFRSDAMGK